MTHENKFGMFIHWGFYALTGIQEQAFARMDIPREKYEALVKDKAYLQESWRKGAEFAERLAQRTLDKAMKKIGFVQR